MESVAYISLMLLVLWCSSTEKVWIVITLLMWTVNRPLLLFSRDASQYVVWDSAVDSISSWGLEKCTLSIYWISNCRRDKRDPYAAWKNNTMTWEIPFFGCGSIRNRRLIFRVKLASGFHGDLLTLDIPFLFSLYLECFNCQANHNFERKAITFQWRRRC